MLNLRTTLETSLKMHQLIKMLTANIIYQNFLNTILRQERKQLG